MPNTVIEPDNIAPPPHYHENEPQVVTSDTARQGPRGTRVLAVLIGALILAGVAWAIIEIAARHG